jgi:murein DD-endopeptidase MepM/ murein hydrolase activator NlpD
MCFHQRVLIFMRRILVFSLLDSLLACSRPAEVDPLPSLPASPAQASGAPAISAGFITPSPDPASSAPLASTEPYLVQYGDTVGGIALEYNVAPETIADLNGLADVASISIGQVLQVPIAGVERVGPAAKIAPDSEVVYGPSTVDFDIEDFVSRSDGYLRAYTEEIEGEVLSGAQIVQRIAERYSVGPRVLLALIELRGGWLSRATLDAASLFYPAGHADEQWSGLYKQLMWAADHLNDGYYGWKTRGRQTILLGDFTRARIAPGLNAGSIALQTLLAIDASFDEWLVETGPDGFAVTYRAWFGDPFARATEPLLPPMLLQPPLALPWAQGETWYFTGGPHGAWASGSAWGAIDFVPPDDGLGCYVSDAWVTSMSDGLVIRSRTGELVVDLDNDGDEQTGWAILYLHVEERDRVPVGTTVKVGDRIGHPSCEGGFSTATHLHIARRYNGEWIAADGATPFVIGVWTPTGSGSEYGGWLESGDSRKDACECRDESLNGITH